MSTLNLFRVSESGASCPNLVSSLVRALVPSRSLYPEQSLSRAMVREQQQGYEPVSTAPGGGHSSIALPITPQPNAHHHSSSSSPPKHTRMRHRFRPTMPALSLALVHLSFFLWWTHKAKPTIDAAHSILRIHSPSLDAGAPVTATGSCEVCVVDPDNALCEYGINSVRLSRQFEGSGVRLRRALEKALMGEEIGIGILGASVTAGECLFLST